MQLPDGLGKKQESAVPTDTVSLGQLVAMVKCFSSIAIKFDGQFVRR